MKRRERKADRKIAWRNRSPYGWWIASYMERAVWDDEPDPPLESRCLAWENTIILKARGRDAAYQKAVKIGCANAAAGSAWNDQKRTGHWVFDGLTDLLPIYEELIDGAEVRWNEYRNRTVRKVRSMVKPKAELSVFDDTPAIGDLPDGGTAAESPRARRRANQKD